MSGSVERRDAERELVVYSNDERYGESSLLGAGGMGEVHLRRDRMIGRDVAVKVALDSHVDNAEMRERFVREARVQGQLEHPAIVPVYDVGLDPRGRAFFTMRRVRGVTLEEVIEKLRQRDAETERTYTLHTLLSAFVRVCLAIEFSHEHGVVHRDLKPANLMFGRHGEVYILDWGLAKVRGVGLADLNTATQDELRLAAQRATGEGALPTLTQRAMLGTPGYMAPEQVRGVTLDGRADVYALGALLFEMLTLQTLHGGETLAAVLAQTMKGVDARPSQRAPHRDVAPELERVCVRATMLAPDDRFPSARDLADSIEAYLSGDRDLALRRELAKSHLVRARAAANDTDGSLESRSTALREVGRALALTPEEPEALAFLVSLLVDPPRKAVEQVEQRILNAARASHHALLPGAAVVYGILPGLLIGMSMAFGYHDARLALVPVACWIVAAILSLVSWRFTDKIPITYPLLTIAASLGVATSSLLHGPLVLTPAIGAVTVMGTALHTPKRNRGLLIGMNALAVGIPMLLVWLGLHPVGHSLLGGSLLVTNGALTFSRGSFAVLGLIYLAFVIMGGVLIGAYHDNLRALQRRAQLQAWQLEQLVPRAAQDAMDSGEPRTP